MTDNKTTSDIFSVPNFPQLFDFTPFSEFSKTMMSGSAKLNAAMQAMQSELTGFVGTRLREDTRLFETLGQCKTLPDFQRAYVQFWETAFTQYGEETQRLVQLGQGVAQEAAQTVQQRVDHAAEEMHARAA